MQSADARRLPALLKPVLDYLAQLSVFLVRGWERYWFTPSDPVTLAFVRICTGLVLSYVYLTCLSDVDNFVGPAAWVDKIAIHHLRNPAELATFAANREIFAQNRSFHEWYFPSVYVLTDQASVIRLAYVLFLVAMVCLTLGFFTRTAAVLSWVGHLSFAHRGYLLWFGLDCVLAMLTFYLLFSPCGEAWSLDSVGRRARRARVALAGGGALPGDDPPRFLFSANLFTRLIQVNMCLIYFCSGAAKLQGSTWWSGQAVWYTLMIPEFRYVDMSWLAKIASMPWLPELVSSFGVAMTIGFEMGFPVFVHVRILRPLVLFVGVALHAGIGFFMGLGSFGAAMLSGLASFVDPSSLRWAAEVLFKGQGGYRFVFDRGVPRHLELASFIHGADPWRQIDVADSKLSSLPGSAGTLVAPDGTVLTGFAAFCRLVRVLRPLWLSWPVLAWKFALA